MRRFRRQVKQAFVLVYGALWCGTLLYLCIWWPMAFTGDQQDFGAVQTSSRYWMVMSGVGFAYLLFSSSSTLRPFRTRRGRIRLGALHGALNERRAMFKGLVGGLLCSLPALAITLVGLIVSVPHPEGWITRTSASDKPMDGRLIEPAPDSKHVYLIGIDLSRSSLRDSKDPRLQQLCRAIDTLLLRDQDGIFPEPIKSEDDSNFYIFAEDQKPLYLSGSALQKLSNSQLSSQVCGDLRLLADRMMDGSDDIGRGRTNIVKFLEDMVGRMKSLPDNIMVTTIVFSDFKQTSDIPSSQDLNGRINALMSDIEAHGRRLVGVLMPGGSDSGEDQGRDISRLLRNHCCGAQGSAWGEIALSVVDKKDVEPRDEFRRQLYSEVRSPSGLQLKYQVFPFSGANNYVNLPNLPEYQRVLLSLRPPEGVSSDMSEFSVAFGDSVLRSSVVKMGETVPYEMGGSNTPGRLPIRLFSPVDVVRTAEFDLLIIAPRRSVTHTVRLMVLPTVGNLPLEMLRWALGLAAVTFVLLVIGASGADLWLRQKTLWLFRKSGWRKRRRVRHT